MQTKKISELAQELGVSERAVEKALREKALSNFHKEDLVIQRLKSSLEKGGWRCVVKLGHEHGIDIEATIDSQRWVIEVKGYTTRYEQNRSYFLYVLGDLLMKMQDPDSKYSVGLPDVPQYRSTWHRLPSTAKERSQITCLFVSETGDIEQVK